MRKFISLSFIKNYRIFCFQKLQFCRFFFGLLACLFAVNVSYAKSNICEGFLGNQKTEDSMALEAKGIDDNVVAFPASHTPYLNELNQTLDKARSLIHKTKELNFIAKSKYDHLLEDLDELSTKLDKKSKHETFIDIIGKWHSFSLKLEENIAVYEGLSLSDQKLYFEKMKLPISFMTSHFITFLETKHLKFDYERLRSILIYMDRLEANTDFFLYLYEFEKQVLKFFSKDEFINCKA